MPAMMTRNHSIEVRPQERVVKDASDDFDMRLERVVKQNLEVRPLDRRPVIAVARDWNTSED